VTVGGPTCTTSRSSGPAHRRRRATTVASRPHRRPQVTGLAHRTGSTFVVGHRPLGRASCRWRTTGALNADAVARLAVPPRRRGDRSRADRRGSTGRRPAARPCRCARDSSCSCPPRAREVAHVGVRCHRAPENPLAGSLTSSLHLLFVPSPELIAVLDGTALTTRTPAVSVAAVSG
jgi:hypothetical protein